jgi:ectoine hydroxylase-related dioxygenase (phytanoyl-CoA dioxygenase family)
MLTTDQLARYRDQGYLIIDPAVPSDLLEPLRQAARRTTEKTRRGEWPHKRQAGDSDIWGVSHLLHPELEEPAFAQYLASPLVLDVVADLLGVPQAQKAQRLQLELVNMLVNPAHQDFEIGWHRDLVRQDLPPDEEQAELNRLKLGVQWNTALYEEACLVIVPGSHCRPKTPQERHLVFNHPKDPLPGQLAVRLKAGQGVYYDANLLHRGVYPRTTERQTLHCCMGLAAEPLLRPHLYRSLTWMEAPGFADRLPQVLRPLHANYLAMAARYREMAGAPG